MKLLIDGDPICYRVGYACQQKEEDGSVKADPESHTLHSVKIFINDMLEDTQATSYNIFLTGKDNFRFKIRDDYKANRSNVTKPVHYQMIRDYLVERYAAQVVDGMEADDALSLSQTDDTAIATIDKDLLMVAGRHYNYVKKEWRTVTPEEGERFFYKQMLTGDRVDNITGIKGIGLKKSDKLLDNTPREEWDKMIIDLYMKEFDNGFQRCVENTQLLWMLQRDVEMPMDFINYEKTKSKATKKE